MTIKELIEELKKYPENLSVVARFCDIGLADIVRVEQLNIVRDYHGNKVSCNSGPHEEIYVNEEELIEDGYILSNALILRVS